MANIEAFTGSQFSMCTGVIRCLLFKFVCEYNPGLSAGNGGRMLVESVNSTWNHPKFYPHSTFIACWAARPRRQEQKMEKARKSKQK